MAGKWLKKIGAYAAAYLLAISLFAMSSAAVFHFVIADGGKTKGILNDSGVYGSFTDAFVDEVAKNPDEMESTIPIKNPAIQKTIKTAFSSKIIKTNTEQFIDGTYGWLGGETAEARFTLDFTKSKRQLAKGIGDFAQKRAAKLPACGLYDIPETVEPFKAKCLPPGITPQQVGAKTTRDILSDMEFLPETKVTPEELFGDSKDNPFMNQDLPGRFQLMKNLFWVFLGLVVILAVATVWLSETRLGGIKKASKSFLVVGALVAFTPLSLNFFSSRLSESDLFNDEISSKVALPIMEELISEVSMVYYIFGAICLLIGAGGLVFAYKMKRREGSPDKNTAQ
jgi:hypothetical protein